MKIDNPAAVTLNFGSRGLSVLVRVSSKVVRGTRTMAEKRKLTIDN